MEPYRTVDWVADDERANRASLVRARSGLLRGGVLQAARGWLALALAGLLVGVLAVVVSQATSLLADLRDGHCRSSWYLNEALCCLGEEEGCSNWAPHPPGARPFVYTLLSLLFAGLASFLVSTLAPTAAGSGISEIKCIVSGFFAPQFLDARTLALKVLALPLVIASGFSVGKEGPSVHYAACVGELVARNVLSRESLRRYSDIVTACCAAGVAVAFGSPIGGVLFAFEEIAYELRLATLWRAYFCCLIATSVVKLLNPYRTGQVVLFKVEYDHLWHAFELPFFAVLGVFGGVAAHYIVKLNLRVGALRKRFWAQWCVAEACLIALLTAFLCYFNMYLHVDMTRSMQVLFHECEHGSEGHASCDAQHAGSVMLSLVYAFVVRAALLIVTYGAGKVPAGIFVPSLAIGALFGRFIGFAVWSMLLKFPNARLFAACGGDPNGCVNPGAYALLGAGALLAGVMHITLTVVVVVFELTGAVHYIVPTMLVVGITRIISAQYGDEGIADRAIVVNGLPYIDSHDAGDDPRRAADIMVNAAGVVALQPHEPAPTDAARKHSTYPIVDEAGALVGALVDGRTVASPLTVPPSATIGAVRALFAHLGPHTVFVTENGSFSGIITRTDFVQATRGAGIELSAREIAFGEAVQRVGSSTVIPLM